MKVHWCGAIEHQTINLFNAFSYRNDCFVFIAMRFKGIHSWTSSINFQYYLKIRMAKFLFFHVKKKKKKENTKNCNKSFCVFHNINPTSRPWLHLFIQKLWFFFGIFSFSRHLSSFTSFCDSYFLLFFFFFFFYSSA